MKQVQKVWAELSAKAQEVETPQESTELSEEVKVELAKIDDLLKEVRKHMSTGQKMQSELSSMASGMATISSKCESIAKEATDLLSKAKELGVEDREYDFVVQEAKGYAQTMSEFAKLIARNMGSL